MEQLDLLCCIVDGNSVNGFRKTCILHEDAKVIIIADGMLKVSLKYTKNVHIQCSLFWSDGVMTHYRLRLIRNILKIIHQTCARVPYF